MNEDIKFETLVGKTDFRDFPKMARYSRECIITEKIDGTNAQILLVSIAELLHGDNLHLATFVEDRMLPDAMAMFVGSRMRWITPGKQTDNYGFASWAHENFQELKKLGPGRHFGEWWGKSIQRGYGMDERVFSLFNVGRWEEMPSYADEPGIFDKKTNVRVRCCSVVPTIVTGEFQTDLVDYAMGQLRDGGSLAAPGYRDPEGIVIWHCAANLGFKKTLKNDESPKSCPGLTNPAQLVAGVGAAQQVFKTKIQNENPKTQG